MKPGRGTLAGTEKIAGWASLYFDGGCAKKEGTGGYALYSGDGKQFGGEGRFYGKEVQTNNEAEATALRDAMTFSKNNKHLWEGHPGLVVYGDSELIINFMRGSMRPSKPLLTKMIKEAKLIGRSLKVGVTYLHVDRELNAVADWLGNEARQAKGLVGLEERAIITTPGMKLHEIRSQIGSALYQQAG